MSSSPGTPPPTPVPPHLPPLAPQFGPTLHQRICRWLFKCSGWRLVGELPNLPKLVLIAAPHSSWWDGFWGLLVKVALGARIHFMGKRELFWWPFGVLLRRMGGIATDRSAPHGVVTQMVHQFQTQDRFWLALAPEGTRKKVVKWKSGFWHIAHRAGVPILPIYFHYPEKTIGIGEIIETTGDLAADMQRIRTFYAPWQGKFRNAD